MTGEVRVSRCAFVVAKHVAGADALYLMRRSKKWHDINFVGGHEEERDRGHLDRTAHRELLEEVPQLRRFGEFELIPITPELQHGPVHSRSARELVVYQLRFFLLRYASSPAPALQAMTARSPNILLAEQDMLGSKRYKISGLVDLLERSHSGGLQSIPLSWDGDLGEGVGELYRAQSAQLQLDFDLPA